MRYINLRLTYLLIVSLPNFLSLDASILACRLPECVNCRLSGPAGKLASALEDSSAGFQGRG